MPCTQVPKKGQGRGATPTRLRVVQGRRSPFVTGNGGCVAEVLEEEEATEGQQATSVVCTTDRRGAYKWGGRGRRDSRSKTYVAVKEKRRIFCGFGPLCLSLSRALPLSSAVSGAILAWTTIVQLCSDAKVFGRFPAVQ